MTGFETYLFLKLDTIGSILSVGGFLLIVAASAILAVLAENSDSSLTKTSKVMGIVGALMGVFMCVAGFMVPTTKEAMIIYAVPTISEYVKNSKELKELPDNVVKTANEWVTNFRPDSITTSAKEFIQIIKTKP